jgi:transcriptional regulator with XRE-family HTH domain
MKKVKPTKRPQVPQIPDVKVLGAFVRASRTAGGLTIDQAAGLIGISTQTLADLEHGKETVGIGIVLRVLANLGQALLITSKDIAPTAAIRILEIEHGYETRASGGTVFYG